MKIVSTFYPTSSVLSSVKCQLSSWDLEHLIVGKLNRIDAYSVRPHGLQHECGLDVWGKVCSVKTLPLSPYEHRSNIVFMITHPDAELIFLSYEESASGKGRMAVQKQFPLVERSPRHAEFLNDFVVHPSGKMIIVNCYVGKMKVMTLKGGQYVEDFDVSIPENNIFSLAFLPLEEDEYAIAILCLDSQGRLQLCARDIDIDNQELSMHYSLLLPPTFISDKVIPCPTELPPQLVPVLPDVFSQDTGGVLVVGGRQILFFDMASKQNQERQRGKRKRLETKKNSDDPAVSAKAKAKEKERSGRTRKPNASIEWPWSGITAWTAVDQSRYLLGDSFGRLSLLSLGTDGMILIPLGQCSQPTTLTYLTNQVVYVGSHSGDSQLLQISPTPVSPELSDLSVPLEVKTVSQVENLTYSSVKKGKKKPPEDMDVDENGSDNDYRGGRVISPKGCFITVLETYKNIAPIMDAVLVDPDKSGQARIVTCSGCANTGSLNIIRNGTEFKELGMATGLVDIVGIWAIKTMIKDPYDSYILVSTLSKGHMFKLENGSKAQLKRIETGVFNTLVTSQRTLAFSNVYRRQNGSYVNSSLAVQVVPTGVHLLEWDSSVNGHKELSKWDPGRLAQENNDQRREIVAASVNASQIALALSGGNVVFLRIKNDVPLLELQMYNTQMKTEISAMSVSPLNHQSTYTRHLPVAYWGTNVVEIFDVATQLQSVVRSPALPSLIRSVLLYNFGSDPNSKGSDYHPYLLVGLADGSLAIMLFKSGQLTELEVVSLGHAPVHLTPCMANGRKCVFAVGNRATIIFVEKGRLTLSPIMLKEISAVSSVNTERFPSSLILASSTGLFVGRVGELKKLHIRSCSFGPDNPRRIIYEPSLRVYGVAFTRTVPTRVGSYEPSRSSFKLIDDKNLTILTQYICERNEEITALASFVPIKESQERHFFCLGTFIYNPEETEPSSGRLLIFTPFIDATQRSSMELAMLASTQVNGCVFALKIIEDKIVAAINSAVVLYRLDISLDNGLTPLYSLKKLHEWNHNYLVTSLGSFGNHIAVGDQICSVSLLEITGEDISLKGRDYGPLYPVAVEALGNKSIICSNDALNISLFGLNKHVRGESLEVVGCYHIAEMVSKFVLGSVASVDSYKEDLLKAESMLFTASGRICAIINIQDDDLSLRLTELQRNMAGVISGVGGRNHTRFRAPKNKDDEVDVASCGFLDGDFLEQYLTFGAEMVERVLEGGSVFEKVKLSKEEAIRILERLRNLH